MLVYLDAVVRFGGFTRAAERLHVAQPAVSVQVRRLEAELGVVLLSRAGRRTEPTGAGELFLLGAPRALGELDSVRSKLKELGGASEATVGLGVVEGFEPAGLAAALAGFHQRRPGAEIRVRSASSGLELLDALDDDRLDLVIAPSVGVEPGRHATEALLIEEVVVLTGPGHRLAGRGAVAMNELRDESFVSLPAPADLRATLQAAATAAGYTPSVPFEATTPTGVRELVAAGLGVALLPAPVAQAPGPEVTVHKVDPIATRLAIGLNRRARRVLPPAVEVCREIIATLATPEQRP